MTIKVGDVINNIEPKEFYDSLPVGVVLRQNVKDSPVIVDKEKEDRWTANNGTYYGYRQPGYFKGGWTVLYVPDPVPVKVGDILVGKEVERCEQTTILRQDRTNAAVQVMGRGVFFADRSYDLMRFDHLTSDYEVLWVPEDK